MKRFFLMLAAAVLFAAGCQNNLGGELSVNPTTLEFEGGGGTKVIKVTASSSWSVEQASGTDWCSLPVTSGRATAVVDVNVSANGPEARVTELVFKSPGAQPVTVTVNQAAGSDDTPDGPDQPEDNGKFYPAASSGITLEPSSPNADEPVTIKFNPVSGNPLYNHSGELYGHLGVIVEGEWLFVPCDWATTGEVTHFKKVADNSWELKLEPSIREYFNSGTTPVTKIAIIVRSADGSLKSHDSDQFCSVVDDKYKPEEFVPDAVEEKAMPEGAKHGINYNSDGSVTFVFYDQDTAKKRHDYCYIAGDWNNWERVKEGAMAWDATAGCWWITLEGFDADKEYRFQYRMEDKSGNLYISDPYTEIVYDQWNDQYIDGVPTFPEGAKQLVSAFQINKPSYTWQYPDFTVEDKNDLVIYEMHFRDFTATSDIEGALAELDYIEDLGVNAVELMPVQEFDGNDSWGYNPNHWFALDKYYGTREEYKQFIDECHKRGIAVIIDVVYNHATGNHPWAKLFWDGSATAANNPWFNVAATHPYNVYHDMNHENAMVKEHVKRSLAYLLEEYNIDGFRFDLSKGFTQKKTDPDVTAWGRKDQSRIDILKGYADHIWSVNEDAVVIFEHLSDWDEEKILAEHGIQLWRNVSSEYRTAVSGGSGDFKNMYSNEPFGGFVGYMESHDEERICCGVGTEDGDITWGVIGLGDDWNNDKIMTADGPFFVAKNLTATATDRFKIRKAGEWVDSYNYGAAAKNYKLTVGQGYVMTVGGGSNDMYVPAAGTYDIYFSPDVEMVWLMNAGERPEEPAVTPDGSDEDALTVAMRRAGASAAFFLTVPGPKMIWQFGEIGYDYSINYNDRTGRKPVVTDEYMAVPARKALYDTYSTLLKFRRENPRFFDSDAKFEWTPNGTTKKITCTVDGKTFHVVGNFAKGQISYTVPSGSWTDYFTGTSVSGTITLKEGEFRLLTSF